MIEAAAERKRQKIRSETMLRTGEISITFLSQVTGLTIKKVEPMQQKLLKR